MKKQTKKNSVYVSFGGHRMHIYRAGDESKPRLVFMSGSSTAVPMYDFKILYSKLLDDFRVIVIEKFGYGYSDIYEAPCDVDSLVSYQRRALEAAGEKGPYILIPHSMSGIEAIRWSQLYPSEISAIIGLDMTSPDTYSTRTDDYVIKMIKYMHFMRKLIDIGLAFWYPLSKRGLTESEIKKQRCIWKQKAMNPCFMNEARSILENARKAGNAGGINCPLLMFVSNGKGVADNWIGNSRRFGAANGAEMIFFDCGHYIHYYESDRVAAEIRKFTDKLSKR